MTGRGGARISNKKPGEAGLSVAENEPNYFRAQATVMLLALGLQRAVTTPSLTCS